MPKQIHLSNYTKTLIAIIVIVVFFGVTCKAQKAIGNVTPQQIHSTKDTTYRDAISLATTTVSDTFYVRMLVGDNVLKVVKGYAVVYKFNGRIMYMDWETPPQPPANVYLNEKMQPITETVWDYKVLYPVRIVPTIHFN